MKNFFVISLVSSALRLSSVSAEVLNVGSGYPFANLQAAASQANAGDTILMHQGTYPGGQYITDLKGATGAWICILARPGENVTVDGGSEAWHFTDAQFVFIHGVTFVNQTGNGVNVDDGGSYGSPAQHVCFDSCTWKDMAATGNNDQLKLSGLDFFEIRRCAFINGSNGGSGIDMVGCHNGLIARNRFEDQGSNSIQAKGGSRSVRIERNVFKNGGERAVNLGGSTGLAFFRPDTAHYEAADLQVFSNVFIGAWSPVAYVGAINVDVANNTMYRPGHWVLRILQETVDVSRFLPCGNNTFRNNIIFEDAAVSMDCNVGSNTAPQSFIFSNNLWYKEGSVSWPGPSGIPVTDSNRIVGKNPGFADTAAEDFSIPISSPAAGAGCRLPAPEFDFAGNHFSAPRSIGAFEAASASSRRDIVFLPAIRKDIGRFTASGIYNIHGQRVTAAALNRMPGIYFTAGSKTSSHVLLKKAIIYR